MNEKKETIKASAPGNIAALRDALEAARLEARDSYDGGEYLGEGADPGFLRILTIIDAAIAAPARNCDRPECATRDGSYNTWYRETWKMSREDCPDWSVWLFAPAEGGAE